MKKNILSIILIIICHLTIISQNIDQGLYSNGYEYLCIHHDTILYNDGLYWYKGACKIEKNRLYFGHNVLCGKNASITKENCSKDSIELKLVTKHKHYLIGMPSNDTNIYVYESDIYAMYLNKTHFVSRNTNGIYIAKGQFSDQILSRGFMLDDSGAGFTDYFNIPLEYGTRYIVKQKYYGFRPLIIYTKDYGIIKYNEKKKELKFKLSSKDKHYTRLKYISNNVDSCFNELKNRFPLLFE